MTRRSVWRPLAASLAVAAVGTAAAAPAWGNLPQTGVKIQPNPIREANPAVSADYFAWSQTSKVKPNTYNAYEQAMSGGLPSGTAYRVNMSNTQGFAGGISGTRLAYEEYANGTGDIRFWNLALHQRSNPPPGVNTSELEYAPTITPSFLLFGRSDGKTNRVLLYNLANHSVRTLATAVLNTQGTNYTWPGQVNGAFATYFKCTAGGYCAVFLYNIGTRVTTKAPQSAATYYTSPAVTSTGTVYYDESTNLCGGNVRLEEMQRNIAPITINTFSNGLDIGMLQTYNDGTNDQLFYTRYVCSNNGQDIYRVTR